MHMTAPVAGGATPTVTTIDETAKPVRIKEGTVIPYVRLPVIAALES
jgi:hypothetical protein